MPLEWSLPSRQTHWSTRMGMGSLHAMVAWATTMAFPFLPSHDLQLGAEVRPEPPWTRSTKILETLFWNLIFVDKIYTFFLNNTLQYRENSEKKRGNYNVIFVNFLFFNKKKKKKKKQVEINLIILQERRRNNTSITGSIHLLKATL
jgi:hypothetical protein